VKEKELGPYSVRIQIVHWIFVVRNGSYIYSKHFAYVGKNMTEEAVSLSRSFSLALSLSLSLTLSLSISLSLSLSPLLCESERERERERENDVERATAVSIIFLPMYAKCLEKMLCV
jgi:hypothetical protein